MSSAAPLLIERRAQYFDYLLDAVRGPIHKRVREWREAILADRAKKSQALKHMQDAFAKVPNWNALRVASETAAVVRDDDVEYLPKLLSALIAVETKLFILDEAIETKDITVRVPSLDAFVHQCFIEASRVLWKNIALFDQSINKLAQQQNFVTCDNLIAKAVRDAVRRLLPIKDIMRHMSPLPSSDSLQSHPPAGVAATNDEESDDNDVQETVGHDEVFESESHSDNYYDEEEEDDGVVLDMRISPPVQHLYEEASAARLQREDSAEHLSNNVHSIPLNDPPLSVVLPGSVVRPPPSVSVSGSVVRPAAPQNDDDDEDGSEYESEEDVPSPAKSISSQVRSVSVEVKKRSFF